jgi:hypothetical protein
MKNTTKLMTAVLAFSFVFGAFFATADAREHRSKDRCEDVSVELDESRVYTRVGSYFTYTIETEGGEAEHFEAEHLPEGLELDEETGVIEGRPEERGTYRVELTAENRCSEDTDMLRIVVREGYGGSNTDKDENEHNVTVRSTFIENDEAGYVYLTEIPYTGAGDVLRLSLIGLALVLWGSALGFALLSPEKKERFKNMFSHKSVALAPSAAPTNEPVQSPFYNEGVEEAEVMADSEELQILRSSAHEEKVLFSENALKAVIEKSQALGGPSLQLLATVIEGAKATYPREDGYLKINEERIAEILA